MIMRFSHSFRASLAALLALGSLFAASVAHGETAPKSAAPHFADLTGLDFATILPAPPAAGSLAAQADLETAAKNSEKVKSFIAGKTIKKVIVVPKKLVNIAVG